MSEKTDADDALYDLALAVIEKATSLALTLSVAESCTGGMIAAALTDIAGSSSAFERGYITYSNQAKKEMIGVSNESLERFGAVSESTAKEMAYGALIHSGADLALSVTGIAGPGGGSITKPVGLVYFGIAIMGQSPRAFECHFTTTATDKRHARHAIRRQATIKGLSLILEQLNAL